MPKYRERMKHGDWWIEYMPKPIPTNAYDWDFWHDDYDPEDSNDKRGGAGPSYQDCIQQIEFYEL